MKKIVAIVLMCVMIVGGFTFAGARDSVVEYDGITAELERVYLDFDEYGILTVTRGNEVLWTYQTDTYGTASKTHISDPNIRYNVLYIVEYNTLYAYDLVSGKLNWSMAGVTSDGILTDDWGNIYVEDLYEEGVLVISSYGAVLHKESVGENVNIYSMEFSGNELDINLINFETGEENIKKLNISQFATYAGTPLGQVYNTDIVAYINNYAIPSYAVNGTSVVIAEDLRNFGFDVVWNESERTLNISLNGNNTVSEMSYVKTEVPGSVFTDFLCTDIKVYGKGVQIPSYAIQGVTMIPVEALTMFGEYNWVEEQRALKLWIDGVQVKEEMQNIPQNYGTFKAKVTSYNPDTREIELYTVGEVTEEQFYAAQASNKQVVVNGKWFMLDGINYEQGYEMMQLIDRDNRKYLIDIPPYVDGLSGEFSYGNSIKLKLSESLMIRMQLPVEGQKDAYTPEEYFSTFVADRYSVTVENGEVVDMLYIYHQ